MRSLIAVLCLLMAGCDNLVDSHIKQLDLLRGLAADVTSRLDEGALAQFQGSGAAINLQRVPTILPR